MTGDDRTKPSQAEGDRETVDAALEAHGLGAGGRQAADRQDAGAEAGPGKIAPAPGDHPSQAEGDRETVDEDLREQGRQP